MPHLAGQIAWDKDGNLVGPGDLAAQRRQALANIRAVLAAAGASPADVLRLRTYLVDHSPEKLGPVLGQIAEFYGHGIPAPNTFIGVSHSRAAGAPHRHRGHGGRRVAPYSGAQALASRLRLRRRRQ